MIDTRNGSTRIPDLRGRPNVAFVDASALVALADWDDASHAAAVAAYDDLIGNGFALFTTNLAFIQAHELLSASLGAHVADVWMEQCRIPICAVSAEDLAAGRSSLTGGTATGAPSLLTAVHLAVLDRLGVSDVFAVERDFLAALG